ncbi:nucleolar complex protein 2 [Acrasis kona]|uniref:Nucleolar complex protein 2 n=1 Tax=Acrasis kona TaxID=1008807 RepID=A0AAW2ZGQ5_9EUKA
MKPKKSTKRFNKNTKLRAAVVKGRRIKKSKNHEEKIKNQKILEEDMSDHEEEENENVQSLGAVTSEEVANFFSSLSKEELSDDEDEINELVADVDDPETLETRKEESDSESDQESAAAKIEQKLENGDVGDDSDDEEQDEEDDDSEEFVKPEGIDDVEEEEEEEETKEEDEPQDGRIKVTKQQIASWVNDMRKSNSLKSLKRMLLAFYSAAHMNDENIPKSRAKLKKSDDDDDDDQDDVDKQSKRRKKKSEHVVNSPYSIPNNAIYMRTVIACLKYSPSVLQHHSKFDPENKRIPSKDGSGWKKVAVCIKSLLKTLLHLINYTVSKDLLSYILLYAEKLLPYFGNYTHQSRHLLKCMLNCLNNEKEIIRYQSFVNIRIMAQLYPYPFVDLTLKGAYFTLVQNAHLYNPSNYAIIDFLKNTVVELCRVDFKTSYQHAFVYIRELAIKLRRALEPKKQSYVECYNWKFMSSLDTWVRAVGQYPGENEFKDLIYPLIQIVLGTIQVHKQAKHFSVIIKCLDMLNTLARSIGHLYIPIMPVALDLLESPQIYSVPKHMSNVPVDFEFKLSTKKQQIQTKEFNSRVMDDLIFVIYDHLSLHSRSIAFPEISFPAQHYLKKYANVHSKSLHASQQKKIVTLLNRIKESCEFCMSKRSTSDSITPSTMSNDLSKVRNFLDESVETPLEKYYKSEKQERDVALVQRIESRVQSESKKNEEIDSDDDEEEEEGGDDEEEEEEMVSKKKSKKDQVGKKRERVEEEEEEKEPVKKVKKSKKSDTVKPFSMDEF